MGPTDFLPSLLPLRSDSYKSTMRLSTVAFLIALPAVAYAAATRQVTQNNTCIAEGDRCVDDDVSAPCCYGFQCKQFKFHIPSGGGPGPVVIDVRHSGSALLLADRCVRLASNKSLFLLCKGGGTGKGSRRGWVGL